MLRELVGSIRGASRRGAAFVVRTPVEESLGLGAGRSSVWLKHEEFQRTGSFKFRGALNKVLGLSGREREVGVVAASTGNHGIAVAEALKVGGGSGVVVVPRGAAREKVERIRRLGVEVLVEGDDCVEAEAFARELAARSGRTFVSPYNDLEVIAGQGTVGVELEEDVPGLDAVFVAVGGGGLISGVAAWLKRGRRRPLVLGAQPGRSDVMRRSLRAGRIVVATSRETLSDATAGGIEPGAVTFDLCRRLVDGMVTVTEREIERAMATMVDEHGVIVEGAAAAAVAAYVKTRRRFDGRRVAIVLCGRNVSGDVVRRVLEGQVSRSGRSSRRGGPARP